MGTEVLRPQDCLHEPIRFHHPRRNRHHHTHIHQHHTQRKPLIRSESKKRVFHQDPSVGNTNSLRSTKPNLVVSGKVTILKRGDSFDFTKQNEISTVSVGVNDGYAGSACFSSPSPRKLPLPSFSKKRDLNLNFVYDDSATKDLRRLLRLE